MEDFTGKHYPPGDFLDENGSRVGTHQGAVRYTIGQRKGLGLAMGAPVYVCAKDMQANTVTVGPEDALFDRVVYADEVNWISVPGLTEPLRVTARTRYHQVEQPATVFPVEGGFRLEFDQPHRDDEERRPPVCRKRHSLLCEHGKEDGLRHWCLPWLHLRDQGRRGQERVQERPGI